MSWWLLGAVLVYAFFLAPVGASDMSTWGRFFYWLFLGGPALLFFYYCAYRGFVDLGVFTGGTS